LADGGRRADGRRHCSDRQVLTFQLGPRAERGIFSSRHQNACALYWPSDDPGGAPLWHSCIPSRFRISSTRW
jgi:hypothetical protein